MDRKTKIAFGGGCHWCTEAVFQSLIGVEKVAQGFLASINENNTFSEAVIVTFNSDEIPLKTLVEIHLHTHKSTSQHSMRKKYRSAVYVYPENKKIEIQQIIDDLQDDFEQEIITQILDFKEFKSSENQFKDYYYSSPEKPFCKTFINPKLKFLLTHFSKQVNTEKLNITTT
ncbi:peptide methionine sulfoxide reductase [Tenacibaculum sp. Bg11-29]|uniref:peptide-methionine (S)-S-oxide reductase n=1 Tax=Tenacibaculum sp. Bg11-29 TaxID=2058306 RepID=UPI000C33C7C4|nr:peptide-methionine (S)-S-oxide reductase [Tenacibaculum sp. Bg11-29]PKH49403.1 peptide methionine sulfoxide reductase [Tenacibaculum sp. Bg11-29]